MTVMLERGRHTFHIAPKYGSGQKGTEKVNGEVIEEKNPETESVGKQGILSYLSNMTGIQRNHRDDVM